MHILILGNDPKTLVNFRGPLIEAMLAAGHTVTAAGSGTDAKLMPWFAARGVAYHDMPIERAGLNPLRDVRTLSAFVRLMRGAKPELLFAYMIKPVVYGLIAAKIAGVKRRTAMITGLGYAFTDSPHDDWRARAKRGAVHVAARAAYGLSLRFADTVIFQNPDDRDAFARMGLTHARQRLGLVNGSGVDLDHFRPAPFPEGPITFLMIARLLRDKGVYEYVEAARMVKRTHRQARFVLVGPFDPNPTAVKPHEVEAWVREGVIEYGGAVDDVRPWIAGCHVFVLPSYYGEGIPRTILEAMAMGRPVITTDWRGCREAVRSGTNGLLIQPRSAHDIASAQSLLVRDIERRRRMSTASIVIARKRFDALQVARSTLQAVCPQATPETSATATVSIPNSADHSRAVPNGRPRGLRQRTLRH
jgi:glycosyltransferase involved in cell wall biosynthesis